MTFDQIPIGTFFKIKKHKSCAILKKISYALCINVINDCGPFGPPILSFGPEVVVYFQNIDGTFSIEPEGEEEDL